MTAEELETLPSGRERYELVRGELITMTPAGFDHGAIVVNVTLALGQHVRANELGIVLGSETGFRLASDPDTIRAPDVAFVRRDRLPASGRPAGYWAGAPDLAVEVLSPSDTVFEVEDKVANWLTAGAASVWVVNPKSRTVTVHREGVEPRRLSERDTLDGEEVVQGFTLPVTEVFR